MIPDCCLSPSNCGTTTEYRYGCRCAACRDAAIDDAYERRRARWSRSDEVTEHGVNAYHEWGCRCDVCRAAWSEYQRAALPRRLARVGTPESKVKHGTASAYTYGCRCDDCRAARKHSRARKESV